MKTKILIFSILGIISEIVAIISLPILFGILIIKLIFFNEIELWWTVVCLISFIVSVPLWWLFNGKVQELNLKLEEKGDNKNEKK